MGSLSLLQQTYLTQESNQGVLLCRQILYQLSYQGSRYLTEVFLHLYLVAQLFLTLCDPMYCSLPDSSVREILQARILEWVGIPSSRGSSKPRDQTQVSCITGTFFIV